MSGERAGGGDDNIVVPSFGATDVGSVKGSHKDVCARVGGTTRTHGERSIMGFGAMGRSGESAYLIEYCGILGEDGLSRSKEMVSAVAKTVKQVWPRQ